MIGRRLRIAAGWMLMAASLVHAADLPGAADTERILEHIPARLATLTEADRRAARQLNAQGDRAYRRRDYWAAFKAYNDSYPNAPNAHAYIMAGDSRWRSVVMGERASHHAQAASNACYVDNTHFPSDLALDVAQHYRVGLALGAKDRRFSQSAEYGGAAASADCLDALVRRASREAPAACVDVVELRRCLGAPLIR